MEGVTAFQVTDPKERWNVVPPNTWNLGDLFLSPSLLKTQHCIRPYHMATESGPLWLDCGGDGGGGGKWSLAPMWAGMCVGQDTRDVRNDC